MQDLWRMARGALSARAIADQDEWVEFLHTRSAYVAQTALFGYLKTRMGTQYRTIFQDPVFAEPLATAQRTVFLHCVADLTIFTVADVGQGHFGADQARRIAMAVYRRAAEAGLTKGDGEEIEAAAQRFGTRLTGIDWAMAHTGEAAFTQSPPGLVEAAPVIKGFKDLDREIVMNSIRFRWNDVRRQFRDRANRTVLAALLADTCPASADQNHDPPVL